MNQDIQEKKHKWKICLYLIIGIGVELPSLFYCLNRITPIHNRIYSDLASSFMFMIFYLIHYSLKEFKRSRSSRLDRKYSTVFLIVFFLNIVKSYEIINSIICNQIFDESKKENTFILIFLIVLSLTQSILSTLDFIITFVKFTYKLIQNHRINEELQTNLINAAVINNSNYDFIASRNLNNLYSNDFEDNYIIYGLLSERNFPENQLLQLHRRLEKFKIPNTYMIKNSKEDEECTICLNFVMENTNENYPIKLFCNHFFHSKCLQGVLFVNNKCPNCRQSIDL